MFLAAQARKRELATSDEPWASRRSAGFGALSRCKIGTAEGDGEGGVAWTPTVLELGIVSVRENTTQKTEACVGAAS